MTVEQTRVDNLAAHIPAHRVHFVGEIHEDSSSNMSTILSLLIVLCSMPCDPAKGHNYTQFSGPGTGSGIFMIDKSSASLLKYDKVWKKMEPWLPFLFLYLTFHEWGNLSFMSSGFRGPSLVAWVQIDQLKHSDVAGFQGTFWKDSPQGLILEKLNLSLQCMFYCLSWLMC